MATVQSIIIAALRKLAVASEDETPSDAMLANGLEAYNNMLSAWVLSGVDLEHTDQALTDTFPIGNEFREGTIYSLAGRLSPDYVVPAQFDADDWFRKIQAAYMTITDVEQPLALRLTSSQYSNGFYRYRGL